MATRAGAYAPRKFESANKDERYLLMDYVTYHDYTNNITFQGDTTYLISDGVVITSGTTTFEGGTVIKYNTNGSYITILGGTGCQINWQAANYLPVVMTSMNNQNLGEGIPGSTGSPAAGDYLTAICFDGIGPSTTMSHFQISYAQEPIVTEIPSITITDGQIVNSSYGIRYYGSSGATVNIYNLLFANVPAALYDWGQSVTWKALNTTFGGDTATAATLLQTSYYGDTVLLTNCILANLNQFVNSGYASPGGACNGFYSNGPAAFGTNAVTTNTLPFQTVGAGGYYLTTNCCFIGVGTNAIDPNLPADIQDKTVFPPNTNLWGYTIFTPVTLSNQVARDDGAAPSLGYHYDSLDYALNLAVSGTTLTILPGTAVAGSGPGYAILLNSGAVVNCQGTATNLCVMTRYTTVQEQSNTNWSGAWTALFDPHSISISSVSLRFKELTELTSENYLYSSASFPFNLRDCQVLNGAFYTYGTPLSVTNCLFRRPLFSLNDGGGTSHQFYNNLVLYGNFSANHTVSGTWTFDDNLFDHVAITRGSVAVTEANNAYATNSTNCSALLTSTQGANDRVFSASPAYMAGTLGDYYYSATNTQLYHVGSRSASAAGLYHYTVTPDNVIDGTNTVSIGFHYVATDANGNPLDTSGTGVPDYILDANGNGVYDSGDFANWQSPFTIFDQGTNLLGFVPPNVRLAYWKFEGSYTSQGGDVATVTNAMALPTNTISGQCASFSATNSGLFYNQSVFNCSNGTVRFWFQPNWTNGHSGAPDSAWFFQLDNGPANFEFGFEDTGNDLSLQAFNGANGSYNAFAGMDEENTLTPGAPTLFTNHLWTQIAMTWSRTNIAVYTNGALLATRQVPYNMIINPSNVPAIWGSGGLLYYPSGSISGGMSLGNTYGSNACVLGQIDELETFNYPLTPQQIAAGFPTFGGTNANTNDAIYIGVSDMLQTNVYGTTNPQVRLGYWKFDSPLLYSEQGQMPLWATNVGLSNGWNGTALSVGSATGSGIAFTDVYTNGWENINCKNGTVRFWYKPNATGALAPLVYVGNQSTGNEWELYFTGTGGNTLTFHTSSSGVGSSLLSYPVTFSTSNWTQIALTYSLSTSSLYINGVNATNGSGVTNVPPPGTAPLGW